MTAAIPIERLRDLADVPEAGFETDIVASPDERRQLAEWAGVDEVSRLAGHVRVHAQSRTRFLLETDFDADIVQRCVVTLAPVRSHIERHFARTLHLSPRLPRFADKGGQVAPASTEEDAPDEIESTRYDLAGPLREEFALAVDPYPRAPGVEFTPPDDADRPESPFTILGKLRRSE
ncbi:MAG: hypothetical protein ACREHF_01420 [Rhizomicrobium sp.]